MSGTTISGTYLTSVTLSNAATQNPATVVTGATLGGGLVGAAGTYWTVSNSGVINNSSAGTNGISLASGGAVFNQSSAQINGATYGIYLNEGGSITNAADAFVYGRTGVEISGNPGVIVNAGAIGGNGTGISLGAGGSITNAQSGRIDGGQYGIKAGGYANITNAASASIEALSFGRTTYGVPIPQAYGIGVDITTGSVMNSGSISGGDIGAIIDSAYLYNARDGVIKAGAGFQGVSPRGIGLNLLGYGALAVNAGTIAGTKQGVHVGEADYLTNLGSGSIQGSAFGVSAGKYSNIYNSGAITASSTSGAGVNLDTAILTNATSGSIAGGSFGVKASGAVELLNDGTISSSASSGVGVYLSSVGGTVTNAASATIKGTVDIKLSQGGTVTNAGTITGQGGKAIAAYGGASRVVVEAGAVFNGKVSLSANLNNTLELASGGGAGTISGLGTSFINFKSVIVDAGAQWELTGANSLESGSILTNSGTLSLSGATLSDAGRIINNGSIELDPSTISVVNLSGTGTVTIDAGSKLAVQGAASAGQHIVFDGSGAELDLNTPRQFSGTISGFAEGDIIDLTSVANVTGSHADMNYTTNVLTVTEGGRAYQFQFDKAAHFAGDFFHLVSQGGGTLIEENQIACYRRGTLIATEAGEVPVESLAIGDSVLTASGALRPIKWIGRRSYGGRFILGRKDILPICLTAGSLADGVPRRDLWISPHHAMALDGVLIEAKDLVNGVSIVQAEDVEEVEYFHVELDSHDVILAEGAPSETFVDDDSRLMFHNAHEYAALYPEETRRAARYCAPRLDSGDEVETVRRKIAERAGLPLTLHVNIGTLRGHVDVRSPGSIEGWAQNTDHPEAPVCLDILAGGLLIGQALANLYRGDLRAAGLGSGRHAFTFRPNEGLVLSPASIEVRRSLDGAVLTGRR